MSTYLLIIFISLSRYCISVATMGGFILIRSLRGANVVPLVEDAVKRMEFRGRDCSGIAWVGSEGLKVIKDSCSITELFRKYDLGKVSASVVLGHTRYSTHGKADPRNAHPHLDCKGSVAIAGDGALRNYEELQLELAERGHRIASKSDFELVSHIVEEFVDGGLSYVKAFTEAMRRTKGLVSALALFRDGTAATYTSHQPLYVGLSDDLVAISSTVSGLYGNSKNLTKVVGGEVVVVASDGSISFLDLQGRTVLKPFSAYSLEESLVLTDGYPHHMLREIYEVPYSVLRTVSAIQARYLELASKIVLRSSRVFVVANGTSLHAGMVFSYYLSELANIVPVVVSASEFLLYYLDSIGVGDTVIAVSQSGETSEVVRSAYEARLRGATVIGATNNINSRLTRFSNLYLPIAAGPELAVPATKTFTSTLILLYLLAKSVSSMAGTARSKVLDDVWNEVEKVRVEIDSNLSRIDSEAREASKVVVGCSSGYVVSRGLTYPLALEGALKIKESAYVHAEGVEGGELRHGPVSILDKNMFVIFIEPLEPAAAEDTLKMVEEVQSYESPTVIISHSLKEAGNLGARVNVPRLGRYFTPISIAVSLQLLAYWIARHRGVNVDQPRRLVKVVKVG